MNPNHLSLAEQHALAILDVYGGDPAQWPAAERQATIDCIAKSDTLQNYQAQMAELDHCLNADQVASMQDVGDTTRLQQRILVQLPNQPASYGGDVPFSTTWRRLLDWFGAPRFALATIGIMVLTMVLLLPQTPPQQPRELAANEFDAWAWYDITGQELPEQNSRTMLTMMDLVDPDLNEDGS